MSEGLVARVQALLMTPTAAWARIAGEDTDRQAVFRTFVLPLAAIPPLAAFIGLSVVGVSIGQSTVFVPVMAGLWNAAVGYGLALVGVHVFAWAITRLAARLEVAADEDIAFKLAAFGPVAAWVSGIFMVIPALSILALLGSFYSLYLLYVGIDTLIKGEARSPAAFIAGVMTAGIVIWALIPMIAAILTPGGVPVVR